MKNPKICFKHDHPLTYYGKCEWCIIARSKKEDLVMGRVHYRDDEGWLVCEYTLTDLKGKEVEKGTFLIGKGGVSGIPNLTDFREMVLTGSRGGRM